MKILLIAMSLGLCGCAAAVAGDPSRVSQDLWAHVGDDLEPWRDRQISLSGVVLAYAQGSVFLLADAPSIGEDGTYSYDFHECIGLIVSREQFRTLRSGQRIAVTGQLHLYDLYSSNDRAVTHLTVRGRIAYPRCMSHSRISPLIFAERISAAQ